MASGGDVTTNYRDTLPDTPCFIFGAGARRKLLYQRGVLSDALSGETLYQWDIAHETIIPDAYTVNIVTTRGAHITICEDEQGVWIDDELVAGAGHLGGDRHLILLPSFEGHPYAATLRILHHEVLVNIVNGKPLPNFFVYARPWMRDAAMMALVLERTGNTHLLADWIMSLRDPFDRNNAGHREADNLGQALYLISLVADAAHPLAQEVLRVLPQYERDQYIVGLSDFAEHAVYQTKWLKYGLRRLELPDPFEIPRVQDEYSALFWMDYRDQHVPAPPFSQRGSDLYPYLAWAEAHFHGWSPPMHLLAERYPLTWEAEASQANYAGMACMNQVCLDMRVCRLHSWHAAEAFLYLHELG